jgi:uncharacterized membrane protein
MWNTKMEVSMIFEKYNIIGAIAGAIITQVFLRLSGLWWMCE